MRTTGMPTTTYSKLRQNLKAACDQVCADREPLIVERKNGEDVVMISRSDYESLEETAYLLRSPANAARLLASLRTARDEMRTFEDLEDLKHEVGL
jgi:antitoxin YefM